MKVFSAYDDAVTRNGVRGPSKGAEKVSEKSSAASEKLAKRMAAREAKEANNKEVKDEAKVSQKAQKKAEAPTEEAPIKSDIAKNDPSDPVTKEKLKAAINSGMIKFNDSERGVLKELIAE